MYVFDGLTGINGKSRSDVVTTLLRLWMHDNYDYLKEPLSFNMASLRLRRGVNLVYKLHCTLVEPKKR